MSKTPALHFFYGKAVLFAALHLKGNVIACGAVGMHRAAYGRVPARINARALRNHRRRHGEARGIVFYSIWKCPSPMDSILFRVTK